MRALIAVGAAGVTVRPAAGVDRLAWGGRRAVDAATYILITQLPWSVVRSSVKPTRSCIVRVPLETNDDIIVVSGGRSWGYDSRCRSSTNTHVMRNAGTCSTV